MRSWIDNARALGKPDLAISVWVLFTFSLTQPLLDLLGRNPEFFLARAAPRLDIVLVAVTTLFILPGALGLAVIAARATHPLAGITLHGLLFMTLSGTLIVSIAERTPLETLDGRLSLALGLLGGLGALMAYVRFQPMRSTVRIAAVGPVVFLFAFLVASPTSQLLEASGPIDRPAGVEIGNPKPIVVLIFDEFPVASLMGADGSISGEAYPNFSRLSRDGIWFRNAMTVEQQTEHAIPTMLTGRLPSNREAIPIAADYPLSLFSLLSDEYEIRAVESVTELCPGYACSNRSRLVAPAPERWLAATQDLSIVTAHLLLPSDLGQGLPSIEQTWGDFAGATPGARDRFDIIRRFNYYVDGDRRTQVDRFLDLIEQPTDQPTLYFAHFLLPHIPWTYLPSGQSYITESPAPGSTPTGWESDEWLVMQAYQRHLLQVQYSDRIVGDVIAALERAGIYEDSLLVITADHGTADIPNVEHRRVIATETIGHIAAVPLFVKTPAMEQTGIDDYRAETVDVLPTIADVIELDIPWRVDGVSLLTDERPDRNSTTTNGPQGAVTFDASGSEKFEVATWRASWFLSDDPFSLVPPGHGDLIDSLLRDLRISENETLSLRLDHPGWYDDVDLESDPFPSRLTGTITGASELEEDLILAIGLNGRIVAVVRTYATNGESTEFQAMLPPDGFEPGHNEIEAILVEDDRGRLVLSRVDG